MAAKVVAVEPSKLKNWFAYLWLTSGLQASGGQLWLIVCPVVCVALRVPLAESAKALRPVDTCCASRCGDSAETRIQHNNATARRSSNGVSV